MIKENDSIVEYNLRLSREHYEQCREIARNESIENNRKVRIGDILRRAVLDFLRGK
jgi:hypothetical protein